VNAAMLISLAAMGLTIFSAVATEPPPFRTGILPVLTKAGCNAGNCHGAATGQGGFKLRLLGYDPEEDYERITRELGDQIGFANALCLVGSMIEREIRHEVRDFKHDLKGVRDGDPALALQAGYRKRDAGVAKHDRKHRVSVASRDGPK
jgi:hypothetical protein